MVINFFSLKNWKKLKKKFNWKMFYHNTGNKKKFLEEFVNGKQQMVVITNMFGIKIDVADIKIIVHTNELKIMLDYAQENEWVGRDRKRSEVMVVWGWIKATKEEKRGGKKNEGKKQMEWKKVIKFLETKCWRVALDKYLDEKKNWINCEEKKEWCQGCKGKKIKEKEVEEEEIKEMIRKKIEEKIKERIEKKIEKKKEKKNEWRNG